MKQIKVLQLFILSFTLLGLLTSRALSSIGIGLYIICGISVGAYQYWRVSYNHLNTDVLNLPKGKDLYTYIALMLMFFVSLIGGVYSEDLYAFGVDMRVRIVFLLVPLAALCFPPLSRRDYENIIKLFILFSLLSLIYPYYFLILEWEEALRGLSYSKHISTHINHIRYSMMLAFACMSSCYFMLTFKKNGLFNRRRIIAGVTFCILFISLHVFSIRTGLILCYFGLLLICTRWIRENDIKFKWFIAGGILTIPIISAFTIPTLRTKILYTLWSIKSWNNVGYAYTSDAGRLISGEAALIAAKNSPITGYGTGDESIAMTHIYQQYFPNIDISLNPHNQFLLTQLEHGLIGILILIFMLCTLFWNERYSVHRLNTVFVICYSLSFFIENAFDTSVSLILFLILVIMGLQLKRSK